tara:strand:- start:535 stop:801 length:267 start_codon:yes stop_codon:yes gene_type:complete
MKLDLQKKLNELENFEDLKKAMSKSYAEILKIDEKLAYRIISEKFNKHIGIFSKKFENSISEANLKNVKSTDDIDLDEYLKDKPIIKG